MRVRSLLLAASLVAGALVASEAQAEPGRATGAVNLRQCASTRCARILTIPAGAVVEVLGREGAWFRVEYRRVVGYAYASYIDVRGYYVAPPLPPPVYYPEPYCMSTSRFPCRAFTAHTGSRSATTIATVAATTTATTMVRVRARIRDQAAFRMRAETIARSTTETGRRIKTTARRFRTRPSRRLPRSRRRRVPRLRRIPSCSSRRNFSTITRAAAKPRGNSCPKMVATAAQAASRTSTGGMKAAAIARPATRTARIRRRRRQRRLTRMLSPTGMVPRHLVVGQGREHGRARGTASRWG